MAKHTNRLANETSPYLLQHAHNPVDWFPWGEEALNKAKQEDKPILVSIGYSACHWCHVMERESFEDEETANLMNEYFINIKIDREERPDLDHIYMDAVQAIAGNGGWPLNVFLTTEGKPFYGGTYFPPIRAFNRISWKEVLENIHTAYTERKHEIESQAENLTQHLSAANDFGMQRSVEGEELIFTTENMQIIADNILKNADMEWGGFGKAPKFPQTFSIQYLLRHYHFTKHEASLKQALLSLDEMIYGGIYDQLGGGFARYSTDEMWLAPHFEKMLYDNALLVSVLAEAYQLTKKELYATTIKETIAFIQREFSNEQGAFLSALDADSEGVEGKFYTWSKAEIDSLLGEESSWFCKLYNVKEQGNWEHTNILWLTASVEVFAKNEGLLLEDLNLKIQQCKTILFEARKQKIRPGTDDKILLNWNALMITACCKAYAALGDEQYKQMAENNIGFLEKNMKVDGNWFHAYKNNQVKATAFLDDYAYLIQAYIHLQEITGNALYLIEAKEITEFVIAHFSDDNDVFFFYTSKQQKDIIVRKKEVYDGATPSGNGIMADNLLYLSVVFDNVKWRERTEQMMNSLSNAIIKYPSSFGVWASIFQKNTFGNKEIVVVGKDFMQTLPKLLERYVPNRIFQSSAADNQYFPLLRNKYSEIGSVFYLCNNYICLQPIFELEEFLAKL